MIVCMCSREDWKSEVLGCERKACFGFWLSARGLRAFFFFFLWVSMFACFVLGLIWFFSLSTFFSFFCFFLSKSFNKEKTFVNCFSLSVCVSVSYDLTFLTLLDVKIRSLS